jgi:hypothetical protein
MQTARDLPAPFSFAAGAAAGADNAVQSRPAATFG